MKKVLVLAVLVTGIVAFSSVSAFASGASIFSSAGCVGCHAINGQGGSVGPDLSHIGSKRSLAWIKKQITDPAAHNSSTSMPPTSISGKKLNALASYLESLK